eukprot:1402435-Prymnesium_polylepis.2
MASKPEQASRSAFSFSFGPGWEESKAWDDRFSVSIEKTTILTRRQSHPSIPSPADGSYGALADDGGGGGVVCQGRLGGEVGKHTRRGSTCSGVKQFGVVLKNTFGEAGNGSI